jgi:Phospholipase_D-nuclease N-terminal
VSAFLAYEWTFLRVFWAMLAFFAWLIVVWLIVMILYDNFARHDHSGWAKAGWTILVIFLPLIGVLIYMIARPATADRAMSGGGV